jgi:integrase
MRKRAYGAGCVYQRGGTWWIKYRVDGKAVYESSKSPKEKAAWTLLRTRTEAVAAGRHIGPQAQRLTLAQLKDVLEGDYKVRERKSWDRAARAYDKIAAHFGTERKAASLTPDGLARYLAARLEQGASRSTCQKELAALKRAYNLACGRGLLPHRPAFPAIGTIHNARQSFVDDWAWALLRPELPDYWQDLGDLALGTGWRCRGELRPLTWAQVDFEGKRLVLNPGSTKNGEGRVFPFGDAPDVDAALRRRLAYSQDVEAKTGKAVPWVFHVEGIALDVSTGGRFYKPWRLACQRANVGPLTPHDFRRTAVRRLVRAGVPDAISMAITGHKTRAVFDRYNIINDADLSAAVRRVRQPATAEA